MVRSATAFFIFAAWMAAATCLAADAAEVAYPLSVQRQAGDAAQVMIDLEVGGELLVVDGEGRTKRLPMSVVAKLAYREQLLEWTNDATGAMRSLRQYSEASAVIKTDEQGVERRLPSEEGLVVAELTADGTAIAGADSPLTREQYDLLDVIGNTLAVDQLLPNRSMRESEGWDHDAETMRLLLGMDHVAVCEVRSVVVGQQNRQVQLRLAGTVHGTVEGATTEMDLRGAYLYHLDQRRITKLNLTVKEQRKAGEVTPGLDVVAKLTLVAAPASSTTTEDAEIIEQAQSKPVAALRQLLVDAPARGYRFCHDASWFVTAEQRELMSLRLLDRGDLLAHCNVTTLPARTPEKPQTLEAFQQDVAKSLGDKLDKVQVATEWESPTGCHCLGVLANGAVKDVPVQWRYYHVADKAGRRATIAVTVEQSLLERFADADRPIVDSMELLDAAATADGTETAAAEGDAARK